MCQAVASQREEGKKETRRTNSYRRTLILKHGGNDCVLTKISHNFHCHFNAPTLCGGLQSHRWRQRVGGGSGTSRQWSRKRVSGAWLVCQSPSIPPNHAAAHTNAGTHSHRTRTRARTHTHKHGVCACLPEPLSPTFWNPQKCGCQKRGWCLTASRSPPGGCRGQTGSLCEEQQQQQRGSKVSHTDRHTWCLQPHPPPPPITTPNIHIVWRAQE